MRGPLLAVVGCLLVAPPALAGPLAFEPAGIVPAGAPGRDLAAVDLTRDGRADLVLATTDGRVAILAGTGPAAFAAPFHVQAGGPSPLDGLAVGRFDADDQPDVAVINTGAPASVRVLRGNGAGLGVATPVDSGGDPVALAAADLDGDGDGDLVVAESTAFQSHVLLGDGTGSFPGSTVLSGVGAVRAVATGDTTGDGLPDVHLAGTAGGFASRNQGNGTFAAAIPQLAGGTDLAVGDVTGDGLADRITVGAGPNRVEVAANQGGGSFGATVATALPGLPTDVLVADLDGDGRLDVVATLFDGVGTSQVAVLRGGGVALEAPVLAPAGSQAVAVAVADVDPDGRPDLLVLDTTGQDVVVLRNATRYPGPLVADAQAQAVGPTTATIAGTVDGRGRAASVRVEYGLDAAYGLATADVALASTTGPTPVSAVLSGLAPGTTYHYRLVATSPVAETGLGVDGTFTTAPPPPTAGLTAATVTRTWAESRVRGAVTVRGRVSHSTQGMLVLLRTGKRATVVRRAAFSARAGAFSRRLALPPTLKPGTYAVELRPIAEGAPLPVVRRTVRLTAPAEGVVDRAYASARRGSSPLLRLPGAPRQLWAHFRFAAAPTGRPITTTWYPPTGQPLVVPRPYRAEIHTFVATDAALPAGRWRCVLRAGGKVVARVSVRVG